MKLNILSKKMLTLGLAVATCATLGWSATAQAASVVLTAGGTSLEVGNDPNSGEDDIGALTAYEVTGLFDTPIILYTHEGDLIPAEGSGMVSYTHPALSALFNGTIYVSEMAYVTSDGSAFQIHYGKAQAWDESNTLTGVMAAADMNDEESGCGVSTYDPYCTNTVQICMISTTIDEANSYVYFGDNTLYFTFNTKQVNRVAALPGVTVTPTQINATVSATATTDTAQTVTEETAATETPAAEETAATTTETATTETAAAEQQTVTSETTYTVQKGDCLCTIAQKVYGDQRGYIDIYNANKDAIGEDYIIHTNQVLVIPAR